MHQDQSAAMGLARRPYIRATERSMKVSKWRGASSVELRGLLPQSTLSRPATEALVSRPSRPKLRLVPILIHQLAVQAQNSTGAVGGLEK